MVLESTGRGLGKWDEIERQGSLNRSINKQITTVGTWGHAAGTSGRSYRTHLMYPTWAGRGRGAGERSVFSCQLSCTPSQIRWHLPIMLLGILEAMIKNSRIQHANNLSNDCWDGGEGIDSGSSNCLVVRTPGNVWQWWMRRYGPCLLHLVTERCKLPLAWGSLQVGGIEFTHILLVLALFLAHRSIINI